MTRSALELPQSQSGSGGIKTVKGSKNHSRENIVPLEPQVRCSNLADVWSLHHKNHLHRLLREHIRIMQMRLPIVWSFHSRIPFPDDFPGFPVLHRQAVEAELEAFSTATSQADYFMRIMSVLLSQEVATQVATAVSSSLSELRQRIESCIDSMQQQRAQGTARPSCNIHEHEALEQSLDEARTEIVQLRDREQSLLEFINFKQQGELQRAYRWSVEVNWLREELEQARAEVSRLRDRLAPTTVERYQPQ